MGFQPLRPIKGIPSPTKTYFFVGPYKFHIKVYNKKPQTVGLGRLRYFRPRVYRVKAKGSTDDI